MLRSPSTARPLRCAYAPALCLAKASFRLPGWGQGLRPCTRFFARFASSLLREKGGNGRARRFHRLAFTLRPQNLALVLRSPSTARALLFKLRSLPHFHTEMRVAFLRCAGRRSPPRPSRGAQDPVVPWLRQKEKAYILDVSLAQIQARRQHHLC